MEEWRRKEGLILINKKPPIVARKVRNKYVSYLVRKCKRKSCGKGKHFHLRKLVEARSIVELMKWYKNDVSFGIEFEGNLIDKRGIVTYCRERYHAIESWRSYSHADSTASFEFPSPVFTSLSEALKSCKLQFKAWCKANKPIVPFFRGNYYHPSVGHHIHVGLKSLNLRRADKIWLVKKVINFLPLLYFLSANQPKCDLLSRRMLNSRYCFWQDSYLDGRHYAEISNSPHGTVEFRSFDANFIQVTLLCAKLLKQIVKASLFGLKTSNLPISTYHKLKRDILNDDLKTIEQLRQIWRKLSFIKLKYQFEKELLLIALRYLFNPAKFLEFVKIKSKYELHKQLCLKQNQFLKVVSKLCSSRKREIVERIIEEARSVKTIGDILKLRPVLLDKKLIDFVYNHLSEGGSLEELQNKLKDYEYEERELLKIMRVLRCERLDRINKKLFRLISFNPKLKYASKKLTFRRIFEHPDGAEFIAKILVMRSLLWCIMGLSM